MHIGVLTSEVFTCSCSNFFKSLPPDPHTHTCSKPASHIDVNTCIWARTRMSCDEINPLGAPRAPTRSSHQRLLFTLYYLSKPVQKGETLYVAAVESSGRQHRQLPVEHRITSLQERYSASRKKTHSYMELSTLNCLTGENGVKSR